MKVKIIALLMVLNTVSVFAQKLELEKASPFTAVKWENEQPIVQFNKEWYEFEKLDKLSKDELLNFCKKTYHNKWKKRFSEDLVEVLKAMDYIPNKTVSLGLKKDGKINDYKGEFTVKNRMAILSYNRKQKDKDKVKDMPENITLEQAIADIKEFEQVLENNSSYVHLSKFDYKKAIAKLIKKLYKNKNKKVSINELANEMAKIMASVGDRHSSVRNMVFDKKSNKQYNLRLPFGIAILNKKFVALSRNKKTKTYSYLHKDYPYVKSINGIKIDEFISKYDYRNNSAPYEAKLSRGASALQKLGALFFINNKKAPQTIKVVFTNGTKNKSIEYKLSEKKNTYWSNTSINQYSGMMKMQKNDYSDLCQTLDENIGYIRIPMMMHYDKDNGLEDFINKSMQNFSNTKALIIDIRNNPGGGREIMKTLSSYIIQPMQSPWVANVAYLRTNTPITTDEESMSGRFLHTYNSKDLSNTDRKAIDGFNKNFKPEKQFDKSKFSSAFYMVLHSGNKLYTKPVYILVNENCFSAATVFTTVFKSLPNVKIVGVTTDGSSGNSRKIFLKHSNIRVKVSTMLSFQRNGKTLDGNGTVPDIYLPVNEEQILTRKDAQLQKLIEIINKK